MKYLIKRNDFLRNAKRLDEKSEFLRDSKLSGNALYQELIKEELGNSGPMENDIGWHDSLVGRFLNHLVRKAKVAANLMRIKPLIRRLEGEFDRIAAEGIVTKMDEEQKKLYIKSILYSFFWELKEAVEKGYEVSIIKNLTKVAIENLESLNDEQLDERTKAKMMDELKRFLEFLNQFEEEGDKDSTVGDEDEEKSDESEVKMTYPTMLSNLQALKLILENYKKVEPKEKEKYYIYITKEGDTIEGIQKNTTVNKKNLTSIDILNKNKNNQKLIKALAGLKTPEEKIKKPLPKGISLVLEDLFISEEATFGEGGGKERHNVGKAEYHLTQAYIKLKTDIEALESPKYKGIGIDIKFLDELISNSKNTQSKDLIKSLYKIINRYLVGDLKATMQEKDPLYKESYEYLMPRTSNNPNGGKMQVVAEKIARFAKRALQFDGENLYGGLGDLSNPLKNFVASMKALIAQPMEKETAKKEESIFKYDGFVSYIKEAEDTSASDPRSGMSTAEKIQDYFDKNCMTVKEFTMEKSEMKKVQANFDSLEKDKGDFVIDGYDPIIEILKIFNRAYKLYMSKAITKRSTGPGVSTSAEYTEFGPNAYRNNKIFDVWESAVLDIMKNRKYQFIFDKKTKLRVGDEMRPNGGASLRKFMTDILDGDKLYKDGGQGAQAKLLDRYFGAPDEEAKKEIEKGTAYKGDFESNTSIQDAVNDSKIDIKTVESSKVREDVRPRSFLVIKAKNEAGEEVQRSFFIQTIDNGVVYMQYSKTFYVFQGYLDRIDGGKKTIVQGDFAVNKLEKKDILYTKVRKEDFEKMLLQSKEIEIGSISKDKRKEKEKLKISSSYWITRKDENKKDVMFSIPEENKDQLKSAIDRAGNISGIITLINTEVDAKIKEA